MNKKVIDKILRIPEDQFQIKPDFLVRITNYTIYLLFRI